MGYFKQVDSEKIVLIEAIQAAEVLLDSYMKSREKCLSKWDQSQFMLDDLQQELTDINEKLQGVV